MRSLALLLLCLGALGLPASAGAEMPTPLPLHTLAGGLPDGGGRPAAGGFIKLIYPSAIAAHGGDVFVADSGAGALLRVDIIGQRIARLGTLPALPTVALAAAPGGGLFVMRPDRGAITRVDRDGRTLTTLDDADEVFRPTAIGLAPDRVSLWVLDADGSLHEFGALGRQQRPLPAQDESPDLLLIAAGANRAFAIARDCRCLAELDREGRIARRVESLRFEHAQAMAVDADARVWLIDGADGRLHVIHNDARIARFDAPALGLTALSALAIDAGSLYLADGPGGRIAQFRLPPLPPRDRP